MQVSRSQLRNLILEVVNEISMKGKQINVSTGGNIIVDGAEFKISAHAGLKTAYQFVDVVLSKIEETTDGLKVMGTALGISVDDIVKPEKIDAISAGVDSGADEFEVEGSRATFKFSRLA